MADLDERSCAELTMDLHRQIVRILGGKSILGLLLLIGAMAVAAPSGGGSAPRYNATILDVPNCSGGWAASVMGASLNDAGEIAGAYLCPGGNFIAFHTQNEGAFGLTPLPAGTYQSSADSISNAGHVVGRFDLSGDGISWIAFLRHGNQFTAIPPLPGPVAWSQATGVNNCGQVVGAMDDGTPYYKAFLWDKGNITWIQPIVGPHSFANDVNEHTVVVGWMGGSSVSPETRAFLWESGRTIDLGPIPGGFQSAAIAMNDNADVVGQGLIPAQVEGFPLGQTRAFLWSNGDMENLGVLPSFFLSAAIDINNSREIVGRCWHAGFKLNASTGFIWRDGSMWDLNDLVLDDIDSQIKSAQSINDLGQILVTAIGPLGNILTMILTPAAHPVADLNADGIVNAADLALLLGAWGECRACEADLNSDGNVNAADLAMLLGSWS